MDSLSDKTLPASQTKRSQPSRFIQSVIWGVLIFIVLCIGAELAFRLPTVENLFPVRSVGSYHTQFEIKWFKLQEYVQQKGGVDVILLGNSMVNTGIDPDILAARYKELTGQHLRIFNFGVEGLTVAPIEKIAQILEAKYHPGTILLYTEIRDYAANNGLDVQEQFLGTDWMQYRMGESSFEGWLIDSSRALQYLLPFRNWSSATFLDDYAVAQQRFKKTTAAGYEADQTVGENVDQVPNPNDPEEALSYKMFKTYSMDAGRIEDLRQIIQLQNQGTKVLVSEFPVYPTYFDYFSAGVPEQYHQQITQIIKNAGSLYLPALAYDEIPLDGRADNHHLNYKGAPIYSNLLAEELAALCTQQQNCLRPAAKDSK